MKPSAFPAPLRAAVQRLMSSYGWTLLDETALCHAVWQAVGENPATAHFPHVITQCYAATLYAACRQSADQTQRSVAYTELHRYLYHNALQRDEALAADLAQEALRLVYTQLDRCHTPTAFFTFALFKLRHVLKEARRRQKKEEINHGLELEEVSEPVSAGLLERLCRQEGWELLLSAVASLPEERQRATIFLKYFEALDDEEIGHRLGITTNHVRVLRTRGIARLRQDQKLNAYFRGA
ncbi:MAG: sigma-70 family RNA polymerase sigma factor [Caldilineaceae bacterium]